MPQARNGEVISQEFIRDVCARLTAGKSVRRSLPGGGLLSIDRQLPFLCVYRHDPSVADAGTHSFVNHEAAYLSAPGNARVRQGLKQLIWQIMGSASRQFGGFLILEVRAVPDREVRALNDADTGEVQLPRPAFRIHGMAEHHSTEAINALRSGLDLIRVGRDSPNIDVILSEHPHAPGLTPLLSARRQHAVNGHVIGLEILPVYRDPETGSLLPKVLDELRRKVSKVLKKTFYAFATHHTNLNPHHYYALGRSRIPRSTWEIDRRLSAVSKQIDLLLLSTPINAQTCWHSFRDSQFSVEPQFQTRPLPFDPFVLKRDLMDIPTERVDDPTLEQLFREVQNELDRQLTMLVDIGTDHFLYGSLQVYGGVEPQLQKLACALLDMTADVPPNKSSTRRLGPVAFSHRAEKEVERYRQLDPSFTATVELRHDLYSGLMVSGTQLLVGRETSIPADRVSALLSHEIGTHLVTRHNGSQQPMQLLQSGLAGYDPLQEGLAVLAEYLVGGLSSTRLRVLAARVVATHAMIKGSDFRDTFRLLTDTHALEHHAAYTIALRVFRGGGLTKDAAYLRGLNQVIRYLSSGGALEPLFVGKLAAGHLPLIRELLLRKVLYPPALLPRYLTAHAAIDNLARLRGFGTVLDLASHLSAVR